MNDQIEKTNLWKTSLGAEDDDKEKGQKKERLRSVLKRIREYVQTLTSKISDTFPELTIHDVTHLDALWETADLIAGEGYPLNPMEAFVFGGAILLHDAAHCFEAYEGGKLAVRNTKEWKDALATEQAMQPGVPSEQLERQCDFSAVRQLHAKQAEALGEQEWKSEHDGKSFFLIEDAELRSRYGALIGKIAASHNWSIDDVKSQLRSQVNAPGNWPSEWRVDPIKIACLLRCSDAAHLDDRRAPDFLFALLRRSGVSLDHWKAQNSLSRVDIDQNDLTKTSLLFTSNQAFQSKDASAWWVAYDAISTLDAEIKSSNDLLRSRPQKESSPPFKVERVSGANSPAELRKSIETEGWIPTSAHIHVSNIASLVEKLGGQNLYGGQDNFAVVMRELIQNARDSIAARRSLFPDFSGKITIRVSRKSDHQTIIEVRDDGIGMSERTMTSCLLDFGTSFWASDLVRSEFPGLRASSFRPVGKFGIGFYSVFMVASEVVVSSKRLDAGLAELTRLHFPNGLTLRPILSKGAESNYDVTISTNVALTIDEAINDIKKRWINKGQPQAAWQAPLNCYLATITAALDVSVELQIENEAPETVHERIDQINTPEKTVQWLKRITFSDTPNVINAPSSTEHLLNKVERIRRIEYKGQLMGLAALLDLPNTGQPNFLTTSTVGGLTDQITRPTQGYLGYMECTTTTAKREPSKKIVPAEVLQAWADDQVLLLKQANVSQEQMYWAASSICELNIDPISIMMFPVAIQNQLWLWTFETIFEELHRAAIPCLVNSGPQFAETYIPPVSWNNAPTLRPLSTGNLIRSEIENGRPKYPTSLIGCLDRLVRQQGRELVYAIEPTPIRSSYGQLLDALIISLKTN